MAQTAPAFPFSQSTINNTRPNTIILKAKGWHEEKASTDGSNIFPGMLAALQSDDSVKRHAILGGGGEHMVVKEDALQGHWFLDPYASGDLVSLHIPQRGDEVLLLVDASAAAIVEGNELVSAGDGTVMLNPGAGALMFDQVADSVALASSTTETAFTTGYTFPANFFQVGDVIKVKGLLAAIGVTATPTLVTKLLLTNNAGTPVVITAMNTSTVSVIASDLVEFDATLVVRTIGATGTLVGTGIWTAGTPGTAVSTPFALASTTFDTTKTWQVQTTGKWSASSSSNTVLQRIFNIEIQREMKTLYTALEAVDNSANASTMAYIKARVK